MFTWIGDFERMRRSVSHLGAGAGGGGSHANFNDSSELFMSKLDKYLIQGIRFSN